MVPATKYIVMFNTQLQRFEEPGVVLSRCFSNSVMADDSSISIMPSDQIQRAIRRMAMQMVEDLHEDINLLLIGINKRGYFTAQLLEQALKVSGLSQASTINLDVHTKTLQGDNNNEQLTKARHIVLVDDVLFSGSTMIQAFRFVLDVVQPDSMKIAVLVDRGHRKFPIQPDYVGIVSPTKLREHVSVQFTASGAPDSVRLLLSGI